jgi:hypothetical protein
VDRRPQTREQVVATEIALRDAPRESMV